MIRTKVSFLTFICFLAFYDVIAQYTEQINSNRPGYSIGAFSVGKGVIQAETGFELRNYKHKNYNESTINGTVAFLSLSLIHISEPTRRTPISYAVFCLKKKEVDLFKIFWE